MIGLDYFLDDKWFQKNFEALKNNRYFSDLPATVRKVYSWSFKQNVLDDKFLYDYIDAYRVRKGTGTDTFETFRYLEIISILMLDNCFKGEDINGLYKKLEKIDGGKKPANYTERLLANVLEIYDLIFQKRFPLNEENFELIVHILFRNLGYDLDVKDSYRRNADTFTPFKGLIDRSLIDNELQNLWATLNNPKANDFSGFTQAIMIGIEMLYISPFDSLNIVLAQFMVKWYLFQVSDEFTSMNFSYLCGVNVDEFVQAVNEVFLRNFNLDLVEKMIKKFSQEQIDMQWKYEWVSQYVNEHKDLAKVLDNLEAKLFMSRLLSIKDQEFNYESIKQVLFKDEQMTNQKYIYNKVNDFISSGILEKKKVNSGFVYSFKNKDFEKTRLLLID